MHLILFISFFAAHLINHILHILSIHPILYISIYALYESHYMHVILRKTYFKMSSFPTDRQTNGLTLSDIEVISQHKVKSCLFGWLTLGGHTISSYQLHIFSYSLILFIAIVTISWKPHVRNAHAMGRLGGGRLYFWNA